MSNKEKIIYLFYTKHLKPVDIAIQLDISNSYVAKIIKMILGIIRKKLKENSKIRLNIRSKPLNTLEKNKNPIKIVMKYLNIN